MLQVQYPYTEKKMNQKIYSEDHVTTPLSPYALTKLKSENFMIKNYLSQSYLTGSSLF